MRGRGLLLIAGALAMPQLAWARYDPCGHMAMLGPGGRVPRNAKIWLWNGSAARLRIRGPHLDRAIAPLSGGSRRGPAAFDPGLLGRDETYEIAIVLDGHAWTFGELATGSELDLLPPRPPGFRALAITQLLEPSEAVEQAGSESSEGFKGSDDFDGFDAPASDIATALDLSDDTIALELAFDDSPDHFIVPAEDPGLLGRNRCASGRRFRVGARICMSIRAIDLAGNRSDPATRCTTVGGRIGETRRTAYPYAWHARRGRHREPRDGWLVIAVLGVGVGWWLASRRHPTAHFPT